jgi:hypothetical protein
MAGEKCPTRFVDFWVLSSDTSINILHASPFLIAAAHALLWNVRFIDSRVTSEECCVKNPSRLDADSFCRIFSFQELYST